MSAGSESRPERNDSPAGHVLSSVCLSVVSHNQGQLVAQLFGDVLHCGAMEHIEKLVLTTNVPEAGLSLPPIQRLLVHENPSPKGFAANHNSAFSACQQAYFCIANPDIQLPANPFPDLMAYLDNHPEVALLAPSVFNPQGLPEDNARRFPTPWGLVRKAFGLDDGRYTGSAGAPFTVDWVAGMFLLVRADAFRDVGGFDERFFLYYEDVDLCARLWGAGWKVMVHPGVKVIHDARRASRRDPRHMRWHAASLLRYLAKHWLRLPGNA
jgi:N-acetylglucosaminyl-diphospho-decaprenol L-rhamnosyltransferase